MPVGKKKVKSKARKTQKASRKAVRKATVKVKKPIGRPALFRTPAEMQRKIDEYFSTQVGDFPVRDKYGNQIYNKAGLPLIKEQPPTVAGLALFLGFADRTSFYEYKARAEFTDTVKRAITRIEEYAERGVMVKDKPTGNIFWLKNHGWTAEENRTVAVSQTLSEDDLKQIMAERLNDAGQDAPGATK